MPEDPLNPGAVRPWGGFTRQQVQSLIEYWRDPELHVRDITLCMRTEFPVWFLRSDIIMKLWLLEEAGKIIITPQDRKERLAWDPDEPVGS